MYLVFIQISPEITMKLKNFRIKPLIAALASVILFQTALIADTYKIVVLPFDKLNKEKNDELDTLVMGISDTLSGALSTVDGFIIIDAGRVKRHLLENAEFSMAIGSDGTKDMEKLRELAKDKLDSDYIISGSFQKIGGKIQLTAKFINVSSGKVMQGVSVNGKYPDEIFTLQEKLAREIMQKITGRSDEKGTSENDKIADYTQSTGNIDAYKNYIKGRAEQIKYDISDYPKAVDYYKKALKFDKKYALAWAGLSEVHALWGYQIKYANGDWEPYLKLAVEEGIKAVEFGPTLYQTHRALSMAYLNNSEFDKAQLYIDEAYRLNNRDAETLQIKAQLKNYGYAEMAKEGTESNQYIKLALEYNPELIIAKWSLAHSYSTVGNKQMALKEYMEVLDINPRHAPSLHSIALIYYDLQDYNNCINYAIKTVEADSKTAHHHYTLGLAYYQLKDWEKSEIALNDAVTIDPDYVNAIITLGLVYYNKAEYPMAISLYQKVLKKDPNNLLGNYNLGLAYYQQKNWNIAITTFQKTVQIDPNYVDAWYSMANCYWYMKQWEKAYNAYNKVLEIDPNNTEARKWRDDSFTKWKTGQ